MKREKLTLIAMVCHEANRAYCISLGDTSQGSWENTPEETKESARLGVATALKGATPPEMHASWSEQKIKDGWTYGKIKNAVEKTHPCLVPYEKLPIEQRRKDRIFIDIVNVMKEVL